MPDQESKSINLEESSLTPDKKDMEAKIAALEKKIEVERVGIKTGQSRRILVVGSDRFKESKKQFCEYLLKAGHKPIEACTYYQEHGGGEDGDRAIEKLLDTRPFC